MSEIKAELIYFTPLWVGEYTGRMSHNSMDKFNQDNPELNSEWIKKIGHDALLKHIDLHFELAMPRTILMEFEKHVIGVCSPNDALVDINQSTRYTLKELIDSIKNNRGDRAIEIISQSIHIDSIPLVSESFNHICKTIIFAVKEGNDTPDKLKMFLPELWMTKGVWKISALAMKNLVKQRYEGISGKPHFLIKDLVEMMMNKLPKEVSHIII